MVSHFQFNQKSETYNQKGKLITGFIHNNVYSEADIQTMKNFVPNTFPWGGDLSTLNEYIQKVAKKGLKIAPGFFIEPVQVFELYDPTLDQIRILKRIHKAREKNPNATLTSIEFQILTEHPVYRNRIKQEFGSLAKTLTTNFENYLNQI